MGCQDTGPVRAPATSGRPGPAPRNRAPETLCPCRGAGSSSKRSVRPPAPDVCEATGRLARCSLADTTGSMRLIRPRRRSGCRTCRGRHRPLPRRPRPTKARPAAVSSIVTDCPSASTRLMAFSEHGYVRSDRRVRDGRGGGRRPGALGCTGLMPCRSGSRGPRRHPHSRVRGPRVDRRTGSTRTGRTDSLPTVSGCARGGGGARDEASPRSYGFAVRSLVPGEAAGVWWGAAWATAPTTASIHSQSVWAPTPRACRPAGSHPDGDGPRRAHRRRPRGRGAGSTGRTGGALRGGYRLKSISSRRVCTVRPLSHALAPGATSGTGMSARFCRLCDVERPSLRSRSWIISSAA